MYQTRDTALDLSKDIALYISETIGWSRSPFCLAVDMFQLISSLHYVLLTIFYGLSKIKSILWKLLNCMYTGRCTLQICQGELLERISLMNSENSHILYIYIYNSSNYLRYGKNCSRYSILATSALSLIMPKNSAYTSMMQFQFCHAPPPPHSLFMQQYRRVNI